VDSALCVVSIFLCEQWGFLTREVFFGATPYGGGMTVGRSATYAVGALEEGTGAR